MPIKMPKLVASIQPISIRFARENLLTFRIDPGEKAVNSIYIGKPKGIIKGDRRTRPLAQPADLPHDQLDQGCNHPGANGEIGPFNRKTTQEISSDKPPKTAAIRIETTG